MSQSIGAYLLERLGSWGVDRIFAYPGDGINGILGGLGEGRLRAPVHPGPPRGDGGLRGGGLRQVLGQGRGVHGHVGAGGHPPPQRPLRRQAGPRAGAGHRRADRPHRPWAAPTNKRSTWPPCSRTCATSTSRPSTCPSSCRTSSTGPSAPPWPPTHRPASSSPTTCRSSTTSRPGTPSRWSLPAWGSAGRSLAPDDDGIRRAAEILNAGSKVAILVGQGARGARQEVTQVADMLGAGVAKALLGKDVLSDELAVGDRLARACSGPDRATS